MFKSLKLRTIATSVVMCGVFISLRAESINIGFYDLGALYDTIPSRRYDDSRFTPHGKYRWDDSKYRQALNNVAAVVDSMAMDIVVLRGVESGDVVRDICRTTRGEYTMYHRELDYYDGLDFALLYFGDQLIIERSESSNYYTYIVGELADRRIEFHLTRRGDKLNSIATPSDLEAVDIKLVWGDITNTKLKSFDLQRPLHSLERQGGGDSYKNGWYFRNRIGVMVSSDTIQINKCGVYITPWLLHNDHGLRPRPLHDEDATEIGYSRHLPQYITISY